MPDLVVKVTERAMAQLIRKRANLDEVKFGFVLRRSITGVIFLVRKLKEKHLAKNNHLSAW